jgi:hypothetical protein
MNVQRYKKFFVLSPKHYERLKIRSIDENTLNELDKKLLKIMKSRKFSKPQKLMLYKRVLHENLEKLKVTNLKKQVKLGQNYAVTNETPKDPVKHQANESRQAPVDTREMYTQTRRKRTRSVGSETVKDDFDVFEPMKKKSSSARRESIFESDDFEPDIVFADPPKTPLFDIYKNDDNEIDFEEEKKSIIEQLEEAVGGPVDVTKLDFQHLRDPTRETIRVYLPKENFDIDIDKSPKLIEYQRKIAKSKPESTKKSPYATRKKVQAEGVWTDYGQIMGNQRI